MIHVDDSIGLGVAEPVTAHCVFESPVLALLRSAATTPSCPLPGREQKSIALPEPYRLWTQSGLDETAYPITLAAMLLGAPGIATHTVTAYFAAMALISIFASRRTRATWTVVRAGGFSLK